MVRATFRARLCAGSSSCAVGLFIDSRALLARGASPLGIPVGSSDAGQHRGPVFVFRSRASAVLLQIECRFFTGPDSPGLAAKPAGKAGAGSRGPALGVCRPARGP